MRERQTKKMVIAALFMALGFILPFFTAQIPEIGSALLPMHIPVLLCGYVCGWQYGLLVGFITPLLRSAAFGMPPLFPVATAMAFELAAYGFFAGVLYGRFQKTIWMNYITLIIAMIGGRFVWGIVSFVIANVSGGAFSFAIFLSSVYLKAIPGIVVQLAIIPILVYALQRAKLMENK